MTDLDRKLAGLRLLLTVLGVFAAAAVCVVVYTATRIGGAKLPAPEVAYAFLAVGLAAIAAGLIAARRLGRPAPGDTDDVRFRRYATATVTRVALLEAPGAVLLVGFLLTANWLVLAPLPVLFAGLFALLPSRAKYDAWVDAAQPPPSSTASE